MRVKFLNEFQAITREVLSRAPKSSSASLKISSVGFKEELSKVQPNQNVNQPHRTAGLGAQPEVSVKVNEASAKLTDPPRLVPAPVPQIKAATKRYESVEKLTAPKASLGPNALRKGNAELESSIKEIGRKIGLDPLLGLAVARTESSLRPNALSEDGHSTKGLFQLKDSTGLEVMKRLGLSGEYNPYDPELNSQLGLSHLLDLHQTFKIGGQIGNGVTVAAAADSSSVERFAIAAFNAGQGRVAEAQARARAAGLNPAEFNQVKELLPEITQNYVDRVLADRGLSAQQEGQDE